jgi:hypothetical protein
MRRVILIAACSLLPAMAIASDATPQDGVYSRSSELAPAQLWQRLNAALTDNGFVPVYEVDGDAELARYQAWGLQAYQASSGARSLSFSSDRYSQRLGALDPRLLAGYPLSVTVVATASGSRVLLPRPTAIELPAAATVIASTLELALVQTIESALTTEY